MYGLIHTALQQMIVENHDVETWQRIVKSSGVASDSFLSMRSYSDSVTMALVAATAEVLNAKPDDFLQAFGQYWLETFAPKTYHMLLNSAGHSLFDFLENLDALHDRITTTFVDYVPPSFKLERQTETSAILSYTSSRNGMVPFVQGLIRGMQGRFNARIECELLEQRSTSSGDRARFLLRVEAG